MLFKDVSNQKVASILGPPCMTCSKKAISSAYLLVNKLYC